MAIPSRLSAAADREPGPGGAGGHVDAREQRRVLEGRLQERVEDVVDAGDLDHSRRRSPPKPEHRHRDRHRPRPLGDVVLGAGEADVRVLALAGHRVLRLGVGQVSLLELPGLGTWLPVDDAEDDPEGVDGGQEGADVAADRQDPVEAAALGREDEDLVLGEEAGGAREGRERQGADDQQRGRERQGAAEAAHPVDVLRARHRRDHRAGRHEQERLEEGVASSGGRGPPRRRRSRRRPPCSRSG